MELLKEKLELKIEHYLECGLITVFAVLFPLLKFLGLDSLRLFKIPYPENPVILTILIIGGLYLLRKLNFPYILKNKIKYITDYYDPNYFKKIGFEVREEEGSLILSQKYTIYVYGKRLK